MPGLGKTANFGGSESQQQKQVKWKVVLRSEEGKSPPPAPECTFDVQNGNTPANIATSLIQAWNAQHPQGPVTAAPVAGDPNRVAFQGGASVDALAFEILPGNEWHQVAANPQPLLSNISVDSTDMDE